MSTKITKTGILSFIAKTKGIKFKDDDAWYNPEESIKDKILPELLNETISVLLDPTTKKFSEFSIIGSNNTKTPMPNNNFTKDEQILRMGALKDAIEFMKLDPENATLETLFVVADKMVDWLSKRERKE